MAGMFAIGLGVYVMNQQIGMISDSIKTIEQGMSDMKTTTPPVVSNPTPAPTPVSQTSHYDSSSVGVIFDYPKGWFVEEYSFPDVDGGKNSVKLTSSQGSLEAAISAGGPICSTQVCFQQGIQIDMRPLITETTRALSAGELTRARTVYQGIDSINGCDGAGCPSQWYVLTCPNGGIEIRTTYTDSSYATTVGEILKNFSAYCQ